MSMKKTKVLCVDDERIILASIAQQLREELGDEIEVETAGDAFEALEIWEENKDNIALVISDQIMPGMKGDEFLIQLHQQNPALKKILLTGQSSMEAVQNAINQADLYRFLSKPWNKTDLVLTVKEAINLYKKERSIQEQNQILQSLYLASKKIQDCANSYQLLTSVEHLVAQNTEPLFQLVYNYKQPSVILRSYIENFNQETIETSVSILINEFIPKLQEESFIVIPNKNNAYNVPWRVLLMIRISDNKVWFLGYQKIKDSDLEWLKLLMENVKIQLQRCILFESLEQKVMERTLEIQKQANIIQEQHRDILQSIQYAKRIQKAIMPKINMQNCPLNFHYLYHPRDIVSGDFYWYRNLGNYILFALGDCTGHGVPGAMLSTLSVSILNQLIADYQRNCKDDICFQANEFLNQFSQNFSESLNRTIDHHAKDGLEIALILYNIQTRELQFAGANMDLWIIRNENLIEIPGDKQSIEGWNPDCKKFNGYHFQCVPNDFWILFTDGIPDQFGGEQNKKFGYKKLRDFFIEYFKPNSNPNQLDWLNHQLREWQGTLPQTDDRLCFVFKV